MISSRLLKTLKHISISVNCRIKVLEHKMGEGINRLHGTYGQRSFGLGSDCPGSDCPGSACPNETVLYPPITTIQSVYHCYGHCGSGWLADMRQPYNSGLEVFDVKDLTSKEPYENFRCWFKEACSCKSIYEPNAMALATATKDGKPSVRMVLMKGFDRSGVKFFTNFNSRKGQELEENPLASVMFFWDALKKVVRIEGNVVKLSDEEADEYFHTRPRQSQLSACASNQSSVIASREVLTAKKAELAELYKDESVPIPKPLVWGGYLLQPNRFEFWQGQSDRLHDRIVFRRPAPDDVIDTALTHSGEDGWFYERLSP